MTNPNNPLKALETVPTSVLLDMSNQGAMAAFQHAAAKLPFYKEILKNHSLDASSIVTIENFHSMVPMIKKDDVFPAFKAEDLCEGGSLLDMQSAIVSSGTSGVFSYGILTKADVLKQQAMVDALMDYYFPVTNNKLLIINALPMGVSFVSSFPVIPTSVRSDIVLHVIRKFAPYFEKIVVITDPNFSKKIIEEGEESGIDWKNIPISFIIGGASSSSSLQQHLLKILNTELEGSHKNTILGTMGLTELGLNIFSTPTDLIEIRNFLQKNPAALNALFEGQNVCPEIMYYFCTSYHLEILDPDANGFGKIIITNIDTEIKTPLIRYDTGDYGKILDREKFAQILKEHGCPASLQLTLPLIAIGGRSTDSKSKNLPPLIIKEALFRNSEIAKQTTGHFHINNSGAQIDVHIQLKKHSALSNDQIATLQNSIIELSKQQVSVSVIEYQQFESDVELSYENKWKHC